MKSKLLIIIILYMQTKWLSFFPDFWTQMKEHRWRLLKLSPFGKVADAELIAVSSKAQRIVLGSFPAASTWFYISEKNLAYVILVSLGNKPKIQGIVLLLFLAWMVNNWKNVFVQTLKPPSQYRSPEFARSLISIFDSTLHFCKFNFNMRRWLRVLI